MSTEANENATAHTTPGKNRPGRDDGTNTEERIEPLAPANGTTPGLLALRMMYDNWKIAESGFWDQMRKVIAAQTSARDIGAALDMLPKDVFKLLKIGVE